MKNTKFQAGTFIELDDPAGGRKVGLVGKDGVTFWDAIDHDSVTPLLIHPVMQPRELGSLVSFAHARGLGAAAPAVLAALRRQMDARQNDALFVMRVLWCLAPQAHGDDWTPDQATLAAALEQAEAQQARALRVHAQAQRYVASL